jgi:hypothetical protein
MALTALPCASALASDNISEARLPLAWLCLDT